MLVVKDFFLFSLCDRLVDQNGGSERCTCSTSTSLILPKTLLKIAAFIESVHSVLCVCAWRQVVSHSTHTHTAARQFFPAQQKLLIDISATSEIYFREFSS